MAIYSITRKEYIWWQDINKVKGIKEIYVTWKMLKNHFKIKYLSKQTMKRRTKSFRIKTRSYDYERALQ